MPDRWVVALALATCAGAVAARPLPLVLALAALIVAALLRAPALLCIAAALLASCMAARAWSGLDDPPKGGVRGVAQLVSDPVVDRGEVRAIARLDGRHVQLAAPESLPAATTLREALARETVPIAGLARPLERAERHLRARHVTARVELEEIGPVGRADPASAMANRLRRVVVAGAGSIPERHRPIFLGMLFGDDRGQPPDIADDFRAAGLGHLLAVSGQNVAFLLTLAAPLLRRLRLDTRLAVTLALVAFFALLTRFEPSVLRACTMATVTATTTAFGRHVSPLRALGLAVSALVLVDPLVVHQLGFQLSVAACAAIAALAPRLGGALPGPRPVADAVAVTIAAQLGVAPLLLATFGPVPLAALPANLLAVPAAGLVMVWGLPVGLLAGSTGATAAAVLHAPTRVLLSWIATVAAATARAGMGSLGVAGVVTVAVGIGFLTSRNRLPRAMRRAAVASACALVVLTVVAVLRPNVSPIGYTEPAHGAELWQGREASVLVVHEGAVAARVLEGLRGARVRRLDALATGPGVSPSVVDAVRRRYPGVAVSSPEAAGRFGAWCVGDVRIESRRGSVTARLITDGTCEAAR